MIYSGPCLRKWPWAVECLPSLHIYLVKLEEGVVLLVSLAVEVSASHSVPWDQAANLSISAVAMAEEVAPGFKEAEDKDFLTEMVHRLRFLI